MKNNKIKRNKAINAFKELAKTLPVDIICNTLLFFKRSYFSELDKLSLEYEIYCKYYNLLKTVAKYKEIIEPNEIYILRRYGKESFSIKNTGDFIVGIVKYKDLVNPNTTDVVNTIDGDKLFVGSCNQICLMSEEEYYNNICYTCSFNPYSIFGF